MESYLSHLMSSSLPIATWGLVLVWLILFSFSHVLSQKGNDLVKKQSYILNGDTNELGQKQNWKLTVFQLLFSSAIITVAAFMGGAGFVFFAGGWIVITAVSIPLNLRNLLFLRELSRPDAATGSVSLSSRLAVQDAAFKLLGMASFCLLLGLVLAHLALLGGALFMSATAIGYLRKPKKALPDELST
jgi:Na+/pantothenate symporter